LPILRTIRYATVPAVEVKQIATGGNRLDEPHKGDAFVSFLRFTE
jgi:hypothetical protein